MNKRLILCYEAGSEERKEGFSGFGEEDSSYCLRFSQQEDQALHIKARYLLWRAIEECSGMDSKALVLHREALGRLVLSDCGSFSFSYGERAFCLYTTETCPVGLDVESLLPKRSIAGRAFSLREREMEKKSSLSVFFCERERIRRWTVKEAVLKARGKGLWQDPASIETGKWGARSGVCILEGKERYFWRSFVWQGHWMSIACREKELLFRLERRGYSLPF